MNLFGAISNANFTPLIQDLSSNNESELSKLGRNSLDHYAMREDALISPKCDLRTNNDRLRPDKTSSCHSPNAKLTMKITKTVSQSDSESNSHSGSLGPHPRCCRWSDKTMPQPNANTSTTNTRVWKHVEQRESPPNPAADKLHIALQCVSLWVFRSRIRF